MAATLTTRLIAHASSSRTSLHRGTIRKWCVAVAARAVAGQNRPWTVSESHLLSTSHSGACDQLIGTPSALGVDLEQGHASRTPISVHTNPRNIGDGSRSAKARTWFCSRRTRLQAFDAINQFLSEQYEHD